ncbi:MAG: hypothetical protein ACR2M5_15965 [Nakamurella sp.]
MRRLVLLLPTGDAGVELEPHADKSVTATAVAAQATPRCVLVLMFESPGLVIGLGSACVEARRWAFTDGLARAGGVLR